MKLFVTGGCGFIGSNFIRYWLSRYPSDSIVNFDLLTYAGNPENLRDVEASAGSRYSFYHGDIVDDAAIGHVFMKGRPDAVINFAAESHNSKAILDPTAFFRTNVLGTQVLLEVCREFKVPRFHQISTCEVYGDLELDSPDRFTEDSPYQPKTPYNASKAAADLAVRAYVHTYGLPATISNCCNNYGPYQFPEKFIPLMATRLLQDKPVHLYRSSGNKREWLHVLDHCSALDRILHHGRIGETYNVGSGIEKSVDDIADAVLGLLDKDRRSVQYVPDRPQHDRRYLLDSTKIMGELCWNPEISFADGIAETVRWYAEHREWWEPLIEKLDIQESGWSAPIPAGRPRPPA